MVGDMVEMIWEFFMLGRGPHVEMRSAQDPRRKELPRKRKNIGR